MRVNLRKLEIYAVLAVLAVYGVVISFTVSHPFSAQAYGVAISNMPASSSPPATAPNPQPAILEPALRSLDGVVFHG
ncbi:MAG: hypothetical protein ABJA83_02485 [Burkholderiaceae bacterium]